MALEFFGSLERARQLRESCPKFTLVLLCILLFSIPLIYFIATDLSHYDPVDHHAMPELTNLTTPDNLAPARYVGWLGFLAFMFFAYHPYRVEYDRLDKYHAMDAFGRLLYDGSFLYVIAGVRDKIYAPEELIPPGVFIGLIAGFSLAYAIVFDYAKTLDIRLSEDAVFSWKVWTAIILPSVSIATLVIVYLLMTAWRVSPNFFAIYVFVVGLVILYHIVVYYSSRPSFHLHHWHWALLCTHACIFNTDASIMAQAAFMAVYIHGISTYGPEIIFDLPDTSKKTYEVIKIVDA